MGRWLHLYGESAFYHANVSTVRMCLISSCLYPAVPLMVFNIQELSGLVSEQHNEELAVITYICT